MGEGAGKLIEGTISLGTILADAGLGTDMTSKVEKYFDDNKIMQFLLWHSFSFAHSIRLHVIKRDLQYIIRQNCPKV